MLANTSGSFRLFRLFGVDVFLHWSWFVVAYIQYLLVKNADVVLHFAMYLTLFGIVLMHEFGHALACRSVGGKAEKIVLWPLGGIAYVQPPQRPGAVLWSIAAGPLVNVALVPVTLVGVVLAGGFSIEAGDTLVRYASVVATINVALLIFNMLPIYPLDGGQIVQAILWFFVGRTKSLLWSARFGLFCALVFGSTMFMIAVTTSSRQAWWLVVMALFIGFQSWRGILIARAMAHYERNAQYQKIIEPWDAER